MVPKANSLQLNAAEIASTDDALKTSIQPLAWGILFLFAQDHSERQYAPIPKSTVDTETIMSKATINMISSSYSRKSYFIIFNIFFKTTGCLV